MKGNQLATTLFFQAWVSYLMGDEKSADEILAAALAVAYTGYPFAVVETMQ